MVNVSLAVLETLQEGVLLLAPSAGKFIITYVNPAVETFEGMSSNDLLGRDLIEVLPRFAQSRICDMLPHTTLTGESRSFDESCVTGSETKWFHYVISMIYRGYLVISYSDITLLIEHQQTADAANKRLQDANVELERFAYVASHDLREPLNKIVAFGERVQQISGQCPFLKEDSSTCKKVDQYLRVMIQATKRSDTLIQDLLAYSRMGKEEETSLDVVDLALVLNSVRDSISVVIEDKKAALEIGPLPLIRAHRVPIGHLFLNLLGNALKFTDPKRAPVIKVTSRTLADEGKVEITVSDNGIGFEPQYAEEIFGVFTRLHSRFEYDGTGMGLAMVRRIAGRYKGSVTAVGVPGEGATFVVRFPSIGAEHDD